MDMSESEIKSFLAIQSHERFAKLFIKNSTTKLIVISKKEIYMYNMEFKYYQPVDMNGKLLSLVSDVLHKAIEPWSDHFGRKFLEIKIDKELSMEEKKEEVDKIKGNLKQISQAIKNIETTYFMDATIKQIVSNLILTKEEDEKLNRLPNYLNFRNGKLSLKTLEFSDRTDQEFITEFLNYDFTPQPNEDKVKEVKQILKRICNSNKDDYNLITDFLGYAITSETKEQKYFNGLGPSASNGKSTLIKLVEEAFSIYVYKAKKDLFSEAFSKGHKYFAQMKGKRIVYIEEQDKKKVDVDLMKDVVDGNKMNNEVLFSTTETIAILFKLMFLSNNLMNFDADSGIKRRLIHFDFKNKFVDKDNIEKEKLTHKVGEVYPLDNTLLMKFKNCDEYKNALVHLLVLKSKKYFDDGLKIPTKYMEIAKDVCEENDKFKIFFENHFEITDNDKNRVSKKEIKDLLDAYYKCNYSEKTIFNDIERLQLNYKKDLRVVYRGVSERGVLVGVKHREEKEEEIVEEVKFVSDLDYGLEVEDTSNDLKAENKRLKMENEKLRAELEELKKKYEMPIPILERSENLEVNFLDELEAAPVKERSKFSPKENLEPTRQNVSKTFYIEQKSKGTKGVMEKMKQKLSE